jgi:hypothetical protein
MASVQPRGWAVSVLGIRDRQRLARGCPEFNEVGAIGLCYRFLRMKSPTPQSNVRLNATRRPAHDSSVPTRCGNDGPGLVTRTEQGGANDRHDSYQTPKRLDGEP